ncbi:substrate-binding domain-containing protein [Dethiobacter alkaliphilus]|uniref:substrate-binding domain-containing protein n=1 Tax=Dethiobacter alkaliphilus TaxID=427926 RepID=UPI0022275363|nr:substrate-binding domain-containing protein [Dethiobacter alkaliphilus]MCW3489189.1 substrate-binding domain-containing protein [Dethiobacter alkaliphilus]
MKKLPALLLLIMIFAVLGVAGCRDDGSSAAAKSSNSAQGRILLATTTSTYDSGLLNYLLPSFEKLHGVDVQVVSLGTGQALEVGKNGDVDLVLVHAREAELAMVHQGHYVDRHDIMYNDFIVAGPDSDPAGLRQLTDIEEVFAAIAGQQVPFISRGDESGTHVKEKALWQKAGISPRGDWYVDTGAGMGDTLRMADEMEGYILTDRATFLSMQDRLELAIVFEGAEELLNQYGVMAVNPDNYSGINYQGAMQLIEYLISEDGQKMISKFKPYGETLFFPNAQ